MLIDLFDDQKEDPNDFVSFIIFEPASLRIPDNDLLLVGDEVVNVFHQVINSSEFTNNIQDQILLNRLKRIEMMIDLLKSNDGLILTKFLNNIWRRYSFFSNLGELFVTQKDLKRLAPNYQFNEPTVLDRYIEADDADDSDDNDSDDNDSDNTGDSKKKANSETKEAAN
ncbi:MAG: hypothetical protein VW397_00765 [Candidatus Margulisiibacteriota bacterium]